MRQDCAACQRLWREYASATTAHVRLESKMRALRPGSAEAEALANEVAAAAADRESARTTIHRHEAEAHGDSTAAVEEEEA